MSMKTISSLAIAAALCFSPAAYAQSTIAGVSVSADDMRYVQARCDALSRQALNAASPASDSDSVKPGDAATPTPPADGQPAAPAADAQSGSGGSDTLEADQIDEALTKINLSSITLADCTTAGLVN